MGTASNPCIVNCAFDEEGVFVYQAFSPEIVAFAVQHGTFGKGFGLDRTSWIKPSFAWTLHRSAYASKHRMESIARIKLHHWAWEEILASSVQSHFDPTVYPNELVWQSALKKANVVCQWDPERGLNGQPLGRQAIQLGLRAPMLSPYISKYIRQVEDVTTLAKSIGQVVRARGSNFPAVPEERPYPLSPELMHLLGCR